MKKKFRIKDKKFDDLIKYLADSFCVPEVCDSMSVFSFSGKYIIEIIFINNKISYRFNMNVLSKDSFDYELENKFPYIDIEPENFRFFLRMIQDMGFIDVYTNTSKLFYFTIDSHTSIEVGNDAYLGNVMEVEGNLDLDHATDQYCSGIITGSDIIETLRSSDNGTDKLFDALEKVDSKIHSYCALYGINLSESPSTINLRVSSKSNDYSDIDYLFKNLTSRYIPDSDSIDSNMLNILPLELSIIIPCFNTNASIEKVLASIESQFITKDSFSKIEVILIDDASKIPLFSVVDKIKNEYSFCIRNIRCEENIGLSNIRNLGANIAKYENLIFLDSDILIEKMYLFEHSMRLRFFSNALYISLKKNIELSDEAISLVNIKRGLERPDNFDDKRFNRNINKKSNLVHSISVEGDFKILNETDNLKKLGYGRSFNGIDLAACVVGHNFSINKKMFNAIGGFEPSFQGWGLEDTFFGMEIIASGNFIIPVLSTGVYHINHPPRSGSENNRKKELELNLSLFRKLIDQIYEK